MTKKTKAFVCVFAAPTIAFALLAFMVFTSWVTGVAVHRWAHVYLSVTPELVEAEKLAYAGKVGGMFDANGLVMLAIGVLIGRLWAGLGDLRSVAKGAKKLLKKAAEEGKDE